MADNLVKKPKKGILKNSSSFEKSDSSHGASTTEYQVSMMGPKEMKWDEMNIIATHHPADKDYGHMKIEEPKTPYNYYSDPENTNHENKTVDPDALAEKITTEGKKPPKYMDQAEESSEDEYETEEERAKRKTFEQKRKLHYNEFQAVRLAKKLMEDDDDDDEEETELNEQMEDGDESTKDSEHSEHTGETS